MTLTESGSLTKSPKTPITVLQPGGPLWPIYISMSKIWLEKWPLWNIWFTSFSNNWKTFTLQSVLSWFYFLFCTPRQEPVISAKLTDLFLLSPYCPQCKYPLAPMKSQSGLEIADSAPSFASQEELGMSKSLIGVILGAEAEPWLEATR